MGTRASMDGCAENLVHTGNRTADRTARGSSLYRLSCRSVPAGHVSTLVRTVTSLKILGAVAAFIL